MAEVVEEVTPEVLPILPTPNNSSATTSAGNLTRFASNWDSFCNNAFILRIIHEGYKIQLIDDNISLPIVISTPSKLKKPILAAEIKSYLESGTIDVIEPHDTDIVSRVFTVPKPDGSFRMIIDLSLLNLKVSKSSFRMEDKEVIKELIKNNDYLVSIDLKNAFHLISLHNDSKRLTAFELDGIRYCFQVLPFGLTSSPRIFSKILKPVISYLRTLGIRITHYLDDILICASSYSSCLNDLHSALSLLQSLGFVVNFKKSSLIPTKSLEHLGVIWNSKNLTLSLPETKLLAIQKLIVKCCSKPVPLRLLASLLGKLVNSRESVVQSPLHYRCFQLELIKALKKSNSWDEYYSLHCQSISELSWWCSISIHKLIPISFSQKSPDITVYVDSSSLGFGIYLSDGQMHSGEWDNQLKKNHINFLELKTFLLALEKFVNIFNNKNITFRSDNNTAVCYFNKKGGTTSKKLCMLAVEIWKFMLLHNISAVAEYLAGSDNCAADYLSRISQNHEYSLDSFSFEILASWTPFKLDMDLFASKDNKKLSKYVSIYHDKEAVAEDSFSFCWPSNIYCFPPIPLLNKCVSKALRDNVQSCLLISPAWHNLPVIPILIDSLCADPIFINSSHLIGPFPTRRPFHVMAWPISASSVKQQAFQRKLQTRSQRVSVKNLYRHIMGTGSSLLSGLAQKKIVTKFLSLQ